MRDTSIEFTIPYRLAAKQGDRSRIVTTKTGNQFVHHYRAKKVENNAKALAALVAPYVPKKPLDGPLSLSVCVVYPWLSKHSKKTRALGCIPKDTAPDWDNLAKQLCDVLQACGFFANDAKISDAWVRKRFGKRPLIHVRLEPDTGEYFWRTIGVVDADSVS